jgi:hypothetical protein
MFIYFGVLRSRQSFFLIGCPRHPMGKRRPPVSRILYRLRGGSHLSGARLTVRLDAT